VEPAVGIGGSSDDGGISLFFNQSDLGQNCNQSDLGLNYNQSELKMMQ